MENDEIIVQNLNKQINEGVVLKTCKICGEKHLISKIQNICNRCAKIAISVFYKEVNSNFTARQFKDKIRKIIKEGSNA